MLHTGRRAARDYQSLFTRKPASITWVRPGLLTGDSLATRTDVRLGDPVAGLGESDDGPWIEAVGADGLLVTEDAAGAGLNSPIPDTADYIAARLGARASLA